MKFSDMMGKGSAKAADDETEATDTAAPTAQRAAASAPEAPIRFGSQPAESSSVDTPTEPVTTPALEQLMSEPSIMDVMNELAPRAGGPTVAASSASEAELDTTAWLEGLGSIDDDLLPH